MNQQVKKPASPATSQPSAKMAASGAAAASSAANKMSGVAYSAAESTKNAAQNVVNISTSAVREMLSSSSGEAQKAQEKMFEMGRESMENMARSADMFTRMCLEMVNICRDNMEAMVECANTAAGLAKNVSSELSESCNKSFAESVELSKEAFNCRTINDVMELQSRAMKQALDTCFTETNRLCNMAFECCTEALEPLNERICDASEKLGKVLAA